MLGEWWERNAGEKNVEKASASWSGSTGPIKQSFN